MMLERVEAVGANNVTEEQVRFYIEEVKPRINWEYHLGNMATNHSNIVLGEE